MFSTRLRPIWQEFARLKLCHHVRGTCMRLASDPYDAQ